jgi:hypothetical protein
MLESSDGWVGWIPSDEVRIEEPICYGGFGQTMERG